MFYDSKNAYTDAENGLKEKIFDFCEGYKKYINKSTTERKCVKETIDMARAAGFVDLNTKEELKAGDKVYCENRGKGLILAKIGEKPVSCGINIVAAHIDSPRLDLKPVPFFEDDDMVFIKTHYYGGIKKYQWTAIPLAMSGVVVTKNGIVEVDINGEDMCFCVTDLLPHLASEQMKKTASEAIEGEKLNLLAGTIPSDGEKYKVKQTVLEILKKDYSVEEEDFISAELEVYPAMSARDVGIDRSVVGGYGQDDRVCAYGAVMGLLGDEIPEKTALCILADKEEVGSMGNTGMRSYFFENIIAEMLGKQENYNDLLLRRTLSSSKCLSADVCAAYDPAYASAYERRNTALFNRGVALVKYTGSRGKGGSSDASAEFLGEVRNIFDENGVVWQVSELGKVDGGGGGTVAQYIANLNVDTIDCGVPLLSMHSPFELAAKADIYMAYKGYHAFYMSK